MPSLPDAYQDLLAPLIDQARRFLERGESLVPFAFVGNLARRGLLPRTRPIVPGELAISD